jgi:hypothetical protein
VFLSAGEERGPAHAPALVPEKNDRDDDYCCYSGKKRLDPVLSTWLLIE